MLSFIQFNNGALQCLARTFFTISMPQLLFVTYPKPEIIFCGYFGVSFEIPGDVISPGHTYRDVVLNSSRSDSNERAIFMLEFIMFNYHEIMLKNGGKIPFSFNFSLARYSFTNLIKNR